MTYPYGTKGAPAIGNGLGGLPRRAVAAAAAAAAGVERTYTFAQVSHTTGFNTGQNSAGAILYFSDSNIYFVSQNSTTPMKSTLNRGARTLASFSQVGSISNTGEMPDSHYDIRVSDTVLVSSTNGKRVTRSNDTLTVDNVVPASGTTTIGGVSYSTSGPIQVRAIPGVSGYVAVIPANSTSTNNSIVFRLDQNLNILVSASVQTITSSISQSGEALVTSDGVLIVVRVNTESPQVGFAAINVDTLALIQRVNIGQTVTGQTFQSYEWHGATIDLQTGRIYSIFSAIVSGSQRNFVPFFTQFNKTTGLFTHFNGTQGNQSVTVTARPENTVQLTRTEDVMALLSTNIKSFGFTPSRVYHNQYSRMIQIPAPYSSSGWSLKVPYAPTNFSDPSGLVFLDLVQEISSGTNLVAATIPLATKPRYQLFWTADPTNGFSNRVGSTAISVGDNLFLTAQIVGDTNSGTCHGKLFLRTEA